MTAGRPTLYTPELGDKICALIATSPYGIKRICKENPDIPAHETISNWKLKDLKFRAQYLQAKEEQAYEITEMLQDKLENLQANADEISLFNVTYRYYQWHTSKLAPKQFGDKKHITQDMSVNVHEKDLQNLK